MKSEEHMLSVGLIQMRMTADPEDNLTRAAGFAETAARGGARIICLPELFRTRYFPQHIRRDAAYLAETIPGVSTRRLSRIAREYNVVLIVPVFEKAQDGHFYNSVVVIDADGTLHPPYHKVHIPQDPGFYEKVYFTPGSKYHAYSTIHGTFGVLTCYDQWFPEAARTLALDGVPLIFYPTAIGQPLQHPPAEGEWQESWELIQRSHAIANSIHVVSVNRVGIEENIHFFGGSFVSDPFGKVLAKAGDQEEILLVSLDLSDNESINESWGFLRNRRPETYRCSVQAPWPDGSTRVRYTPRNCGFSMPAEWEPHDACWMAWPDNPHTFPQLEAVRDTYTRFITALNPSDFVELLVPDEKTGEQVIRSLGHSPAADARVRVHVAEYADVWFRDYGPTFVVNYPTRTSAMVHWDFNAWGEKYEDLIRDKEIPLRMNRWLGLPLFSPGIILEGGSIDVNGRGTVMTTRSCLLNPNRNPRLSETELEEMLVEYLGVEKVIWLPGGITGDDTDGHIDDVARFTGPSTVVCAYEDNPGDENYTVLRENYETLCQASDQDGSPLTVVKLPLPGEVTDGERRYPASYTNFYIGNTRVIVPVFDDPNDKAALRIIGSLFPGREIIGIEARALVEGCGAFHCVTQQQPTVRRLPE